MKANVNNTVSSATVNSAFVFTGNKRVDAKLDTFVQKLYQLMGIYEDMIGLKELKGAQQSVIEVFKNLIWFIISEILLNFYSIRLKKNL